MQYAVTVSGGYATPSRWSVRGSLGAVLGGRLEGDGLTHDIGPGFVGLDQCNVHLPRTLIGKGLINVTLTVDNKVSNPIQLNFK